MAKTEVILTHSVTGLGAESDQLSVAAGYARNYLFPQGLAISVTAANKRRLEVLRQRRAEREAHEFQTMSELGQMLGKLRLIIKVKTSEEGKLYGSVTAGTIADELSTHYDATLDKRKIHLPDPIRALGEHDVELRLHSDIKVTLKVIVESTTPLAKKEEPAPTEMKSPEKAARGERRAPRQPRVRRDQRKPSR